VSLLRSATAPVDLDGDGRLPLTRMPLILMYHNVDEVQEDPCNICVTPRRFAEQMAWLERRGLRGVGVAELVEAMRHGRGRGLVGLTFDDGYEGVSAHALPELARRGFNATVFLVTSQLGGTNDWDEGPRWPLLAAASVEALLRAGVEIGSHSDTHRHLAGASARDLTVEVADSRAKLAAQIGRDVVGFAYPNGSIDDAARTAVRAAGYGYACAVHTPPPFIGPFALPRVYVGQQDRAARMDAKRLLFRPYVAMKGRYP
jgi:peptidoglycan/xylan/chitin deacetylase (PgdA/CDA1 family)